MHFETTSTGSAWRPQGPAAGAVEEDVAGSNPAQCLGSMGGRSLEEDPPGGRHKGMYSSKCPHGARAGGVRLPASPFYLGGTARPSLGTGIKSRGDSAWT
jgi:hypothetical protein